MRVPAPAEILESRLIPPRLGVMAIKTTLSPFAIITYAVDPDKLRALIPSDRFELTTFLIDGQPKAFVSAVPFVDIDFHFSRLPIGFSFGQVNYRAYVIDRQTGEHCVWFFGTTLGSPLVCVPRHLWRMPWHRAHHEFHLDKSRFSGQAKGRWGSMNFELVDTGQPPALLPGFATTDEMTLILTHPIEGYFRRSDGRIGRYAVWHEIIESHSAEVNEAYFSVFEELRLLTRQEMKCPASALFCRSVDFLVDLPPRAL